MKDFNRLIRNKELLLEKGQEIMAKCRARGRVTSKDVNNLNWLLTRIKNMDEQIHNFGKGTQLVKVIFSLQEGISLSASNAGTAISIKRTYHIFYADVDQETAKILTLRQFPNSKISGVVILKTGDKIPD